MELKIQRYLFTINRVFLRNFYSQKKGVWMKKKSANISVYQRVPRSYLCFYLISFGWKSSELVMWNCFGICIYRNIHFLSYITLISTYKKNEFTKYYISSIQTFFQKQN